MAVAVWMGWYVQGFCWNMNPSHTATHTPRREFENSKVRTMNKIIIRKLEDRLIEDLKFEKFPRVEPNFRFLHY